MWRVGVIVGLIWGMSQVAYAGEFQEAGAKVWSFSTQVFVVTDKVLHWSWETLHNKVVHPVVHVITFGAVDLSNPS